MQVPESQDMFADGVFTQKYTRGPKESPSYNLEPSDVNWEEALSDGETEPLQSQADTMTV